MSFRLTLDALTVDSFVLGGTDSDATTLGRDCTYEPVCPRTDTTNQADGYDDAVGIGKPKTYEPGCTLPEICHQDTTVPL